MSPGGCSGVHEELSDAFRGGDPVFSLEFRSTPCGRGPQAALTALIESPQKPAPSPSKIPSLPGYEASISLFRSIKNIDHRGQPYKERKGLAIAQPRY